MKKEEIHWADWHRIFIGDTPSIFLLEVLIRSIIIYFVLLITLRLMGKRMSGQLTISEMAVMLTLGAIISLPMQAPDKGILQGIAVLSLALLFQRGISFLGFKSEKIEQITQGRESLLVKNGVIQLDALHEAKISKQQLFTVIRDRDIFNLGQVERLYLEACGLFNLYLYKEPRSGLTVFPAVDKSIQNFQERDESLMACESCGHTVPKKDLKFNGPCPVCNYQAWQVAVKS
jgi:uncharacterized membrane protein YcaP (DUF421 family)